MLLAVTVRTTAASAAWDAVEIVEIESTEIAGAWRHPQLQTPPLQQARWPLAGDESRSDVPVFM